MVAGITALVTIQSLRASLDRGIGLQARELLGSDLLVSARQPFDGPSRETFAKLADAVSYETNFTTMLSFPGSGARLVQLRAVEGGFPFYGTVLTDPEGAWREISTSRHPVVLVEPALPVQFGRSTGDDILLGSAQLRIDGTVRQAAPRTGRFAGFAPDVYVNRTALDATGLLDRTSLANYHAHLRLPDGGAPAATAERLQTMAGERGWEIETPADRREQIGNVLDRFERFLSLIALFSLVLGAIGVAGAMQAQIRRRRTSIAVLRCLGLSSSGALAVYLAQAAALGLASTIAGTLLGTALHSGIVWWFRDELPLSLALWPPAIVVARSAAAGFLACIGFALLPLFAVRDIPPLAVLRNAPDGTTRRNRWRRIFPVGAALFALLVWLSLGGQTPLRHAFAFPVGLLVVFLLLALAGRALITATRSVPLLPGGYLLHQGLANLGRPQNQTLLFIVSLGLGVFLLSLTVLARAQVLRQIEATAAGTGPNLYLVDVQPDQTRGVEELLAADGLPVMENAPMVAMRLDSVNGRDVAELLAEDRVPAWVLRREFRSSYRDRLNPTERTIAGTWPPPAASVAPSPVPLSLETGMAEDLGVGLGDRIVVNVQGRKLETVIVHLREVDWSRLNLNFFMLFPPGTLEGAPGFNVFTTRVPEEVSSGRFQALLARGFPNVSAIDLRLILETVRNLLDRVAQAVQILSVFTLVAGTLIMAGIFLNGRDQRMHDAVLLRTLGASTRQLRAILGVEFGVLGALASAAGCSLALLAHAAVARFVFDAAPVFPWLHLGAVTMGALSLALLMGAWLSRGVCQSPPLTILRGD